MRGLMRKHDAHWKRRLARLDEELQHRLKMAEQRAGVARRIQGGAR